MRAICVPGISKPIPVIGFGCSSLSSAGKKKALCLLETAFDSGVRHFDVARYYGYGEAEGLVGAFLKTRRAEVTITTKFGIQPPERSLALRFGIHFARRFAQLLPAARTFIRDRAQAFVRSDRFSAKDAQISLETSLAELGTECIDFFLLHEYQVSENSPDELLEFLASAVKAGKIRYFGLATGIESTLRAIEQQPQLCRILQFENSVLRRNTDRLPETRPDRHIITHGSLSRSYGAVSAFLRAHRDLTRAWSMKLGIDCSNEDTISALMLNYAVYANQNGLVVFSSRNELRVTRNVKAVLEPEISNVQIATFGELVEKELMPSIQM